MFNFRASTFAKDLMRGCLQDFRHQQSCSAQCGAVIDDYFSGQGCCQGTVEAFLQEMILVGEYPSHLNLADLAKACGTKNIDPTLKACVLQKGTKKQNLKVSMKVSCSSYNALSVVSQQQIVDSFKSDMGGMLGLPDDFLAQGVMACDTNVVIQITASGRFKVLAVQSGVSASVQMQAATDRQTSVHTSSFASAAAGASLSLPSTSSSVLTATGQSLQIDNSATRSTAPNGVVTGVAPNAILGRTGGTGVVATPANLIPPPTVPFISRPASPPRTLSPIGGFGGGGGGGGGGGRKVSSSDTVSYLPVLLLLTLFIALLQ